ncbi:MAG: hypothetical protein GY839_06770 [candidate division Zixibacteria bacterium]|nr:hypothetical protein [candidate division Zixibacteria bacterium]
MKTAFKSILTEELLKIIHNEFALEWYGCHGILHWLRVRRNGLALCEKMNGNSKIAELFSVIHDCKRMDNGEDILHGKRASSFIGNTSGMIDSILSPNEIQILKYACEYHTTEDKSDNPDIQICWDADRLDLGRVGKKIDKIYINTSWAKDELFVEKLKSRPINNGLPSFFTNYIEL